MVFSTRVPGAKVRALMWIALTFSIAAFYYVSCQRQRFTGLELVRDGIDENAKSGAVEKDASLRVLFVGNSHSAPLPGMLREIFLQHQPNVNATFELAPGTTFLIDRLGDQATLDLIENGNWDYVVLQAQKYSTSGKYVYSTEGAETLARLAIDSGANVLMYPEWSRKGMPDEYRRIRAIHDSIAKKTGAVVVPIGEAWEMALNLNSDLELYDPDGNHASALGEWLNACVFYSALSGKPLTKATIVKGALLDRVSEKNTRYGVTGPIAEDREMRNSLQQIAWTAVEKFFVNSNKSNKRTEKELSTK